MSILKAALLAPAMLAEAYRPAMVGREPAAFQSITEQLELAMGQPVDMVRIHVADEGYDFIRNLAASGPEGTMVMSKPARLTHFQQGQDVSAAALRSTFSKLHLKVQSLDFAVNFANLAFDQELELLVLALPAPLEPKCSWIHPTLGCEPQIRKLQKAFASPANILKFEPSPAVTQQGVPMGSACYDLDTYYFMLRTAQGKPVVLLYSPCIREKPSSSAAAKAGSVGRAEAIARLEALGVTVVEVSDDDFQRRACNAINPHAGEIVFSEPVSQSLQNRLRELDVRSTALQDFVPGREFGIHCLTLELPPKTKVDL
ncbi:MAG: hypothetical protein H7255_01435 [Ramlibacter sp.]|nr:hypothetical protein [Ramlibacter sp.]